MTIEAVRFFLKDDKLENILVALNCSNGDQLDNIKRENPTTLYLVKSDALNKFRKFVDIVVDRRIKHEKIALSRYLLNQEKIPLLESDFKNPNQTPRSIRDLIKRAKEQEDHNVYILGVCEDVFAELKKKANKRDELMKSEVVESQAGYDSSDFSEQGADNEPFKSSEILEKLFLGASEQAQKVRYFIECAAKSEDEVLILGETGTGKEVVAKAIHMLHFDDHREMQVINCGAISENLFESELFGYKKGAFTGADKNKKGIWELAQDSTLFLDEIGDLSRDHQAKILRVISDKKVRPVGSDVQIDVNARVIAATNVDLVSKVRFGEFREDLYYRLNTFPIFVPPLRDRKKDISILARSFWDKFFQMGAAPLTDEVLSELQKRDWPGNVRVLHSFLRCFRNLNHENIEQGDALTINDLDFAFAYHGQQHFFPGQNANKDDVLLHPANCLRRLKRVSDIFFSLKLAIPPLLDGLKEENIPFDSIKNNIQDLEMLCKDDSSLFYSVPTLNTVWRYVTKMKKFNDYLRTDVGKANNYWVEELAEELTQVMETVFAEIEKITA